MVVGPGREMHAIMLLLLPVAYSANVQQRVTTSPAAASSKTLWRSAVDPQTGCTYYWNVVTRDTTWMMPEELCDGAPPPTPPSPPPASPSTSTPSPAVTPLEPVLVQPSEMQPVITWNGPGSGGVSSRLGARASALRTRWLSGGSSQERDVSADVTLRKSIFLGGVLACAAAVL